jgi:hypothetical protein
LLGFVLPRSLSRSVPMLPPNDLAVRDLSFRFIRTPSREVVAVVSGKLLNTSGRAIPDVTLQALGFNERGEIVVTARAPLRSALANEKVSDLDEDTIVKFQRSLGARDASIAPNETVPFTIALLDESSLGSTSARTIENLSKVKYFSARVFSVR